MNPISSWSANAQAELVVSEPDIMVCTKRSLDITLTSDTLWLIHVREDLSKVAFRLAFSPSGRLYIMEVRQEEDDLTVVSLSSSTADYKVEIFCDAGDNQFRFNTIIIPKIDLQVPYWPKDILCFDPQWQLHEQGRIHTHQRGTRSGIIYFNDGLSGSVFYLQNLSALNAYFEATQSSAGDTVNGEWPEIGFSLPASAAPLLKGISYCISDAFIQLDHDVPVDPEKIAVAYLNHLAEVYIRIPKPTRHYHDWLGTVERGLNDLLYHKGCWTFADGHSYLNAYVADYKSPPEVMVQLAVLLPMVEYLDWKGEKDHQLVSELKAGLDGFYVEEMKTIVRWLPAMEKNLDHSEEQKKPRVMDAWYLHHPLMNLARLADHGDKDARNLLLNSIAYTIKAAHTFKYQWPVFYQMDTLKVIKAETAEGEGGEKDVPGTYADLMLRMWKLTGDKQYLTEAKSAAEKLEGLSFDVFYQANNTAYAACAMLNLYKETSNDRYLQLSYVCIAALFDNVQLWECDYGHARNYPTFFGIFPLKDAPYTAAYEEQEVYAALSEYLQLAEGIDILPSIRLLIAEFIRHIVGRVAYYYPPMLKPEMIAEEVKTGEVDVNLWVALEDLHDGWEASGEVGQEVYGAGIAFGIIPKQYYKVKDESFTLFCDYPIADFKLRGKSISFHTHGDERLDCRVILLTDQASAPYQFTLKVGRKTEDVKSTKRNKTLTEFNVCGNQQVKISW